MAEPRIQYAKTSDGVSIAYCVAGEGKDLLWLSPPPFCHVQLDWESFFTRVFQPLAQEQRLAWFDWPGTGLSDRDPFDFSMDSMIDVVETIVERTGLQEFALASLLASVPIALTYAARWPDRVTRLILADGWAAPSDLEESASWQAEKALRNLDWQIYTETFARVLMGYEDDEYARLLATYMRACVEPDANRSILGAIEHYDASSVVSTIKPPTLVAYNQNSRWVSMRSERSLAASIPNATFLLMDDLTYGELPDHINKFLTEPGAKVQSAGAPSGTAVILFADIAESTALTERVGDAAFREKARELDGALRGAIASNGGTAIDGKLLGDGVLATFGAAREAIACATAIHEAGSDAGLSLHVGIHAGDVIREDDNVYGGAVNIAARVASEAAAGETLVSATVRDLARTSAGVSFDDRGERELKGVEEPVRLYEVRWRD